MNKLFNILKTNRKKESDFNLDQILQKNDLDYKSLSFEDSNVDVFKSFNHLNKKLNTNSNVLRNLRSILPQISFNPILKPLYTIILTSLVIFSVIILKDSTTPVQFTEISVDKGEKITLHVTDNLTIHLNSESAIKIPLELKRNSKIYVKGEAYFKIARDKKTTIVADGIILNTKKSDFHINTKNTNQLVAHVKEGNVEFYSPNLPRSTKFILNSNDKAIYNSDANFIAIEKEDSKNYLAWHTGIIEFNDAPLYAVTEELSNHFQIPIHIDDMELSSQKVTAKYKNLEIDNILDNLQSRLKCQISADGSKIVIH